MKLCPKALLAGATALALTLPVAAQTYRDSGGTVVPGVVPIEPGVGPLFTPSNPGVISGSFAATLSGFQPTPAYSQLSVSSTSSRVALPSGAVIVVYNTGSNPAYVTLGGSSVTATTGNDIIQPNSWMSFTVGPSTYLAAVTSAGTTALNISGGSGLPTGAGGGGGGGGGSSSITTWAGGTLGAMTNYGTSPGAVPVPGVNAFITNTANENNSQWAGTALGAPSNYGTSPGPVAVPGVNAYVTNQPIVTTTPKAGVFTPAGQTVGTSSMQVLPGSTATNHIQVQNTSASATIACSWGGVATLNSSGSFQLAPGQSALWGPNTSGVPSSALNCISSAASTPLYLEYN